MPLFKLPVKVWTRIAVSRFLSAALLVCLVGFALPLRGWPSLAYRDASEGSSMTLVAAGSPVGTVFLVPGKDLSGQMTDKNSLGQDPQEAFPEPMSLTLFGAGLIIVALVVRRRTQKVAKAGAKANAKHEWISEVGRLT